MKDKKDELIEFLVKSIDNALSVMTNIQGPEMKILTTALAEADRQGYLYPEDYLANEDEYQNDLNQNRKNDIHKK